METLQDKDVYSNLMSKIEALVNAGNGKINPNDMVVYANLAKAANEYESQHYVIEAPTTLNGLLEMKMYEMRLKQKEMAIKLNISDAKLSLILHGKQKPDLGLLRKMHTELGIDGNVLLDVI